MRVAIIDESTVRASIIEEGLRAIPGCESFVVTGRQGWSRESIAASVDAGVSAYVVDGLAAHG